MSTITTPHVNGQSEQANTRIADVFPGTAPEQLAVLEQDMARCLENDDDALYPPAGMDVVKFRMDSVNRECKRICQLVQGGALCGLLFGTTPAMPVVGADGKARKSGARSGKGKGHRLHGWQDDLL